MSLMRLPPSLNHLMSRRSTLLKRLQIHPSGASTPTARESLRSSGATSSRRRRMAGSATVPPLQERPFCSCPSRMVACASASITVG